MHGRTRFKRNEKKKKFKSYREQKIMESHDYLRPE